MNRHRFLPLLLVIAVLGASAWLTLSMNLDKSLKALLPDTSPALRQSAELLDLAPFSRILLIQLTAEEPSAARLLAEAADELLEGLEPEILQTISLEDSLPVPVDLMRLLPALCDESCLARLKAALAPENISTSLGSLKNELAGAGSLNDFFWRADPLNWRNELFSHVPSLSGWPLPDPLIGYPLTKDGQHLLIMLKPQISMNDTAGAKMLMGHLNGLIEKLPAGLSAQIVGAHRHTAANAEAIEHDLRLTLSLAMLLILAIYLFLVRSFGAFWLFLTPAVAVLAATAALSLAFPIISALALGFGAGVLGIAEDYAVHVHFALRRAPAKTALEHVARPLLMSCLLSVAGFAVLFFSSIPAIRQLAFFSAAAIVIGYLWAIVILPHCPGINSPSQRPETSAKAPVGSSGGSRAFPLFLALAVLSALLTALVPLNASIRSLGFSGSDLIRDQESVETNWKLDSGRRVYLAEGESTEKALLLAREVSDNFNAVRLGSAASLSRLIPDEATQKKNMELWRYFQAEYGQNISFLKASAVQQGYSAEAFRPFESWFTAPPQMIGPKTLSKAGLGLMVDNFLLKKNSRSYALILADKAAPPLPPQFEERVFQLSAAEMEQALSLALSGEKRLLPFCVLICLLILLWTFKCLDLAMLAFIPALSGLVAVLLLHLLTSVPLGLAECAALPLIICLGADYGIVVVSELKAKADLGAPRAIFVSGLSTIAGIGILILAAHPVLHSLGKTVFAGLAAAMPVSIFLLPKLWKK